MRLFQSLLAAVALATAVSAAPAALAQRGGQSQAATAIVINYQRLIATSDIGRDMSTKLQAIAQQMQGELAPDAQAIQAEQTSIQTATQGMSNDQVRANHALSQRIETFSQRVDSFRTRQQHISRDMEYTQQATLNDFNTQITPIVREVMTARNAGIVLDSAAVQLSLPAYDATDDVVQRLNQRLRTMTVTRQAAPAEPAPGAPAAPAPAAPH